METATMGKVIVSARIENLDDLFSVNKGQMTDEEVRRIDVSDALIDTGATGLLMPKHCIAQLGLQPFRTHTSKTVGSDVTLKTYMTVRLTVLGRECHCDVTEISDDLPVLIGQVPLELMDWVVDLKGQRLIGNPAHGGQFMHEAYGGAT
jgi:predicted aspartyl protease